MKNLKFGNKVCFHIILAVFLIYFSALICENFSSTPKEEILTTIKESR